MYLYRARRRWACGEQRQARGGGAGPSDRYDDETPCVGLDSCTGGLVFAAGLPGEAVVGFPRCRWNGKELGLPSRGPISWEEMGERTPEGRGSSLWTPFSGGVVWGEVVLLAGYLACGPHIERPVTARPPAGRAGDVDGYPLGKGGE